jgi:hypothetical protein
MGNIAEELLGLVAAATARGICPRVRAVHLPVGFDVASRDAEFCALELDDGSVGFSFVLLGNTLADLARTPTFMDIAGRNAADIARWYAEAGDARRAIGLAAINAITQSVYRRAGYLVDVATDSIGLIDPQPGDHIGMIGLFRPLVERILATGARLTVAELKAELAQESGRFRVTLNVADLASCNKVVSTSTLLLNDTQGNVLDACRGASYFGIIGPSAGCMPDPLFSRGVDTLGGMCVVDLDGFRSAFGAGQPWGRYSRKTCIRRDTYPGFSALLDRTC